MTSKHHKEVMERMPQTCISPECVHTKWGGRNRSHWVTSECPMYKRELRKAQDKDRADFDEAMHVLPKNDLNRWIRFDPNDEEVKMSLESFLALAGHFQGHIEYGIKQTHGGEDDTSVYVLPGMPFSEARDLAEMAGRQLMQKFDSGWIEA